MVEGRSGGEYQSKQNVLYYIYIYHITSIFSLRIRKVLLGQTTTPGTTFPTLCDKCVGPLTSPN